MWPSSEAPHMMWSGKQVAWPSMRKCSREVVTVFKRAYKRNSAYWGLLPSRGLTSIRTEVFRYILPHFELLVSTLDSLITSSHLVESTGQDSPFARERDHLYRFPPGIYAMLLEVVTTLHGTNRHHVKNDIVSDLEIRECKILACFCPRDLMKLNALSLLCASLGSSSLQFWPWIFEIFKGLKFIDCNLRVRLLGARPTQDLHSDHLHHQ